MDFKLKDKFVNEYSTIEPNFGFNGLGELVYLRTYSRLKENGSNEKWYETIRRVVEGTYSIQKEHILKNNLGWNEKKAHRSAEEMYDRMFTMKFLPPGRGLWAMGTEIITRKALYAALNSCAFVSTKDIKNDLSRPFEFMMEFSMLGVGIGFDIKGKDILPILKPSKEPLVYAIPDTREGWVESLKMLLNAFFKGSNLPEFHYNKIRKEGSIIKSFGGKSSGAAPLRKLHKQIEHLLTKRIGSELSGKDITDIMNMIGVCVVSGNVRRTAQIVFGEPDEEYLKLKNYTWNEELQTYVGTNIERAEYGWASNNSIFAKIGQDYTDVAKQTAKNGEPGYFWLENAQNFSRMNNGPDFKDHRAMGGNPCLEQTLESYEMCCLVETFPTKHESLEDFTRTLKFAYLYAKTVTLGKTHWVETNRVQLRNRRIGASVSGIAQFVDKNGLDKLKTWLRNGYDTIQYYDNIYSDWFAVPKSVKTTSVKPSGSVSLLAGVTPGLHYPESNYYIRRIRISKDSNLIPYIKKAGYEIEPDVNAKESTLIVEIPVSVNDVRTIYETSMWEQLLLAEFMQKHWADNQVSCTVTFNESEKDNIAHALNYFQYKLKGISFLPKSDETYYPQIPYEKITEKEYKKQIKKITKLDFNTISEDATPELYCDGDSCMIQ